jgi:dipeptidase E
MNRRTFIVSASVATLPAARLLRASAAFEPATFHFGRHYVHAATQQVEDMLTTGQDSRNPMTKLLLTSSGVSNKAIHNALVELLSKPIADCRALFIPTGMYAFPRDAAAAWQAFSGKAGGPLCDLGWKSLGVLELTSLPSLDRKDWVPMVEEADALLVWGGDPVYLSHWMRQSGLTSLLPSLRREVVYVGVSAGSMAASTTFAETYTSPPSGSRDVLTSETVVFSTPHGEIDRLLVTAHGAGMTNFALIPHLDNEKHPDASLANAKQWAAKLSVPVYAIDDQTAIKVIDGNVEVVSEGHWKLFDPPVRKADDAEESVSAG